MNAVPSPLDLAKNLTEEQTTTRAIQLAYRGCADCKAYADRRSGVFIPAVKRERGRTGETLRQVFDRFFAGVHARHQAGGSL